MYEDKDNLFINASVIVGEQRDDLSAEKEIGTALEFGTDNEIAEASTEDYIVATLRMIVVAQEEQIHELNKQVEKLSSKVEGIYPLVLSSVSDDKLVSCLKQENDYYAYFELLKIIKSRYLIVIAVCDTAGDNLPEGIYQTIIDMGFSKFRNDLWRTYIGVSMFGEVIAEEVGENEKKSAYYYRSIDGGFRLHCKSESWRNGDQAVVEVRRTNYAVNKRGINIVVYDTKSNKLIDSVCLDAHEGDNINFWHKGE